jgi:hypothetical protein
MSDDIRDTAIVVGTTVGGISLMIAAFFAYVRCRLRQDQAAPQQQLQQQLLPAQNSNRLFSRGANQPVVRVDIPEIEPEPIQLEELPESILAARRPS